MYKYFIITGMLIVGLGAVAANDFYEHDDIFFNCLKTCTSYSYKKEIKYNNGDNIESYEKSIKLNDKGSCDVSIVVWSSSTNPPANAFDGEVYRFPKSVLKKINKDNFKKYAEKYDLNVLSENYSE